MPFATSTAPISGVARGVNAESLGLVQIEDAARHACDPVPLGQSAGLVSLPSDLAAAVRLSR